MTTLTSEVDTAFRISDLSANVKRHLARITEAFAVLRRTLERGFLNGHPINKHIDTYIASLQKLNYFGAQQAAKEMYTKHYYEGGRRGKRSNKKSVGAGIERFSTWIKALKDLVTIVLRTKQNNSMILKDSANMNAATNPRSDFVRDSSIDTFTEDPKRVTVATSSNKHNTRSFHETSSSADVPDSENPTALDFRSLDWMDKLVPRIYNCRNAQ